MCLYKTYEAKDFKNTILPPDMFQYVSKPAATAQSRFSKVNVHVHGVSRKPRQTPLQTSGIHAFELKSPTYVELFVLMPPLTLLSFLPSLPTTLKPPLSPHTHTHTHRH